MAPRPASAALGVLASAAVEGSPKGIAEDPADGYLYVAVDNGAAEGIDVIEDDGTLVSRFGRPRSEFEGVAFDPAQKLLYASQAEGQVSAFSASGASIGVVLGDGANGSGAGQIGSRIGYVAVDPLNGDLLVADSSNRRIDEFEVRVGAGRLDSVEFVRAIGWGVISHGQDELQECTLATGCLEGLEGSGEGEFGAGGPTRVAADASGAIYALDPSNGRVERFGADGSASTFASAALTGVSPEEVAVQASTGDVYVAGVQEGDPLALQLDADGRLLAAQSDLAGALDPIEGLAPDQREGGVYLSSESPSGVVLQLGAISPQSVGATQVSSDSATLSARLNPGGTGMAYRFEYGESTAYEDGSVPAQALSVGASEGLVGESAFLEGLAPGTTYHYRVVALSELADARSQTFFGEDHSFTTRPAGTSSALLDGREWELVSPAEKHNAAFEAPPAEGGVIQASEDGGAITYISHGSTEGEPRGEQSPEWAQIISKRSTDGWLTSDISPSYGQEWGVRSGHPSSYLAFSEDLSRALVEPPPGSFVASSGQPEPSPYLRDESACSATPQQCERPLVSPLNVPAGTRYGGSPESMVDGASFVSSTSDLRHVVLRSEAPLTTTDAEDGLYEYDADAPPTTPLKLLDVLPESEGGAPAPAASASLGFHSADVRHAISADGSRVIWSTRRFLYMRDTDREETILISQVQGGSGQGELRPVFQTASSDGSKVFFTDEQHLTAGATGSFEEADLYVFEVDSAPGQKLSGHLRDLTPVAHVGEQAAVQGMVLGASEDGSSVYFVTAGVLAGGGGEGGSGGESSPAMVGADNLYYEHYEGLGVWEAPKLIAVLSRQDGGRGGWSNQSAGYLQLLTARVSSDGQWLAFMSERPLTGYDNHDALSGRRDEEVYLYDAVSGKLVCASCQQTDARPLGVLDPATSEGSSLLIDRAKAWEGHWLAASLPGWTMHESAGSSVQQPRYLDDAGRLFFDSSDALTPGDVNGVQDVYEYEPDGVGSCDSEEAGDGCQALVSLGVSPQESAFMDASASGEDVFFLTAARLLPEVDLDDAYDLYDAHVCSALVPCTAGVPQTPPCGTVESCRPPAAAGSTLLEPATALVSGDGNLPAPKSTAGSKAPTKKSSTPKGKPKGKSALCRMRAKRVENTRRRATALKKCTTKKKTRKPAKRRARV